MSTKGYCPRSDSLELLQDERVAWLATLDASIFLGIRPNRTLTLYYRGMRLLTFEYKVREAGYKLIYTTIFANLGFGRIPHCLNTVLSNESQKEELQTTVTSLCKGIDKWYMLTKNGEFQAQPKRRECEISQLIVLENNRGSRALSTQFYFCDSEYQRGDFRGQSSSLDDSGSPELRPDLVGIHWPTKRLVLGEVKLGDNTVCGKAGISAHVKAFDDFLSKGDVIDSFKIDMIHLFEFKLRMGHIVSDIKPFSCFHGRPIILLIICDHKPMSRRLCREFNSMPRIEHADVKVAQMCSSTMEFGLYDSNIIFLSEVQRQWAAWLYSGPKGPKDCTEEGF